MLRSSAGAAWGAEVAGRLLQERADDGSNAGRPNVPIEPVPTRPFKHRPDPTVGPPPQDEHAPHWGGVTPFGFQDLDAALAPLVDPLTLGYPENFDEVAAIGEEDAESKGARTAEQTETGIFWAYDGEFKIGQPNRMFNQVVDAIVDTVSGDAQLCAAVATGEQVLRLYAGINVAMVDASIQVRPVCQQRCPMAVHELPQICKRIALSLHSLKHCAAW